MLKRRLSLSLLVELNQTRLAVKPIAARLAALQRNGAKKAAVASAIARMAAADCESDNPLASDIAFHVAIMRATDNRCYAQLCDLIETALRSSIRTTNQAKGDRLTSVADHRKVSDAIMEGDASKAESAMRYLIQESLDLIRTAAAGAISFAQPPNAVSVRMAITQDRALELLPGPAP